MKTRKLRLDWGDLPTGALLPHQLDTIGTGTGHFPKRKRKGSKEVGPGCAHSSHPAQQQLAKGRSEIAGGWKSWITNHHVQGYLCKHCTD